MERHMIKKTKENGKTLTKRVSYQFSSYSFPFNPPLCVCIKWEIFPFEMMCRQPHVNVRRENFSKSLQLIRLHVAKSFKALKMKPKRFSFRNLINFDASYDFAMKFQQFVHAHVCLCPDGHHVLYLFHSPPVVSNQLTEICSFMSSARVHKIYD